MTEERITETTDPVGNTHTTHTVVSDDRPRGGTSWVVMLLVLAVVVIGIWFLTQMGGAEMTKDAAVADAANQVGTAANEVGDAAQSAGEAVENAVEQ